MLKVSSLLALLTGLLLAIGEVQANWGDWQWWPWWLVDFVATAALIFGSVMTLRKAPSGPMVLGLGWAFTTGMVWMSLAGNVADGVDPGRDGRMMGSYVFLLAALLATSALGAVLTLMGTRQESLST